MDVQQADDIRFRFNRMREQGHAMSLIATYDSKNKLESLEVVHLLTCLKCLREGRSDDIR